jgi:hypothetical protein
MGQPTSQSQHFPGLVYGPAHITVSTLPWASVWVSPHHSLTTSLGYRMGQPIYYNISISLCKNMGQPTSVSTLPWASVWASPSITISAFLCARICASPHHSLVTSLGYRMGQPTSQSQHFPGLAYGPAHITVSPLPWASVWASPFIIISAFLCAIIWASPHHSLATPLG